MLMNKRFAFNLGGGGPNIPLGEVQGALRELGLGSDYGNLTLSFRVFY